jgi:hypothetical protein
MNSLGILYIAVNRGLSLAYVALNRLGIVHPLEKATCEPTSIDTSLAIDIFGSNQVL